MVYWEREDDIFQGKEVVVFTYSNLKYLITKKVYKQEHFSLRIQVDNFNKELSYL